MSALLSAKSRLVRFVELVRLCRTIALEIEAHRAPRAALARLLGR